MLHNLAYITHKNEENRNETGKNEEKKKARGRKRCYVVELNELQKLQTGKVESLT